MCVLNRNPEPRAFTFDWKAEKLTDELSGRAAKFDQTTYQLRNLWTHQEAGTTLTPLSAQIPGHDVLTLRLSTRTYQSAVFRK